MSLFAATVAERTRPGQRQDVEEQSHTFHAVRPPPIPTSYLLKVLTLCRKYGRTEGVCIIMITDQEYPALVAHQVLSKVVDEFLSKHPPASWRNATAKNSIQFPPLKEAITKYQDPQQADSIVRISLQLASWSCWNQ